MAKMKTGVLGTEVIMATPKKSRQGRSEHSKLSATSRNKRKKKYRGQGK